MRFKSLVHTRFFCLPIRLPWMSSPSDPKPLHLLLDPLGNPDKQRIAVSTLETLYLRAEPIVHKYVVSQITLWKRNKLPNHEFVVARISYEGTAAGALRMERTVEPTNEPSGNSSSVSLASSSSSALLANDPITIYASEDVGRVTKEAQLIAQQDFRGNTVTIASVIAASSVLSREYPEYKLGSKQCYWFAGLVFRLIAGDDVMPANSDSHSRMRAGEFASFLNIMQGPGLTKDARAMRPMYEAKLREVEEAVADKLAKERQAQEDRQKAQMTQGAERRAQEAERHAQEAERQKAQITREAERREAALVQAYELEIRQLKEALASRQTGTAPSTA